MHFEVGLNRATLAKISKGKFPGRKIEFEGSACF